MLSYASEENFEVSGLLRHEEENIAARVFEGEGQGVSRFDRRVRSVLG